MSGFKANDNSNDKFNSNDNLNDNSNDKFNANDQN